MIFKGACDCRRAMHRSTGRMALATGIAIVAGSYAAPAASQAPGAGGASPPAAAAANAPADTPAPASSAAAAIASPVGDSGPATGEIVVTAQKRSESINKVPLSITAATGEQLTRAGVVDTRDLAKITPGFTFAETSIGVPVYTLRGIGFYDQSLSSTPAVSVYNDEVPLSFPAETRGAILDLERVEVLKGPQGTLFGQAATGGAINYIAAKPTDHLSYGGELSAGRFWKLDASGYVSGPITDTLSIRVSGAHTQQLDGWQYSYTHHDTLGTINKSLYRAIIDWHPAERLKIRANVNGWIDKSQTQAPQLVGSLPQNPAAAVPGYVNYPRAPGNDRAADWSDVPGGHPRRDEHFVQASLRADYELSDAVTLTSISSYDRLRGQSSFDADGLQEHAYDYTNHTKIDSEYQELRLTGKTARFDWIVGGNYEHDKTNQETPLSIGYASLAHPAPGFFLDEAGYRSATRTNSYGIYGNAEYKLLDNLSIQGGIRYSHADHKGESCGFSGADNGVGAFFNVLSPELSGGLTHPNIQAGDCYTLGPAPTFEPGLVDARLKEHNISWRAVATWTVRPGSLVYVNVSKGYKGGGIPGIASAVSSSLAPYKQESVQAYEAGVKTSALGHHIQLNAAGFYYDYSNKQILGNYLDQIFGIQPTIVNIPKSRIWGVEGQIIAAPVTGVRLSAGATYLNAKIRRYEGYDTLADFGSLAGTKLPFTPAFTSTLDAEYEWRLAGGLKPFVGTGFTYNSKTNAGVGELPQLKIIAYGLLDLRAGVRQADDHWSLTLFANNVTNKYYWSTVIHVQDGLVRYTGMPMTFGARFGFKF